MCVLCVCAMCECATYVCERPLYKKIVKSLRIAKILPSNYILTASSQV